MRYCALSAIEQMKSLGKTSLKTLLKLAVYKAELSPNKIKSSLNNFPALLKGAKPISYVDGLFKELKRKYDSKEVVSLLQFLLAKRDIERLLGIKIKFIQNKKKASKKTLKKKKKKP